jgi:hypothetical protein
MSRQFSAIEDPLLFASVTTAEGRHTGPPSAVIQGRSVGARLDVRPLVARRNTPTRTQRADTCGHAEEMRLQSSPLISGTWRAS